eukprot:3480932-Pyramimonas_sp.AAC.1
MCDFLPKEVSLGFFVAAAMAAARDINWSQNGYIRWRRGGTRWRRDDGRNGLALRCTVAPTI